MLQQTINEQLAQFDKTMMAFMSGMGLVEIDSANKVKAFITSAMRRAATVALEETKVKKASMVHSKECEFQRHGCDCGFMEDVGFNQAVSEQEEKATKFLNQ